MAYKLHVIEERPWHGALFYYCDECGVTATEVYKFDEGQPWWQRNYSAAKAAAFSELNTKVWLYDYKCCKRSQFSGRGK